MIAWQKDELLFDMLSELTKLPNFNIQDIHDMFMHWFSKARLSSVKVCMGNAITVDQTCPTVTQPVCMAISHASQSVVQHLTPLWHTVCYVHVLQSISWQLQVQQSPGRQA